MKKSNLQKYIMTSLGLIIFLLSPMSIVAQANESEEANQSVVQQEEKRERNKPNIIKELDLDDTQIDQIKEFRENNQVREKKTDKQLRKKNDELRKALFSEDAQEEKIELLKKEISKLNDKKLDNSVNRMNELRSVLTEDQLLKLKDLNKKQFLKHRKRQKRKNQNIVKSDMEKDSNVNGAKKNQIEKPEQKRRKRPDFEKPEQKRRKRPNFEKPEIEKLEVEKIDISNE